MPTADAGTTFTVWVSWTSNSTTSGSITTNAWTHWMSSSDGTSANTASQPYTIHVQPPPETAEARQAREQAERERTAARVAAQKRAEDLLLSLLDENQRRELAEHNSVSVFSELQKRYRIRRGRSGNVDELDDGGRVVAKYCAHPNELVPDADTMAAQLLMLTHNEREFLRVANRTAMRQ